MQYASDLPIYISMQSIPLSMVFIVQIFFWYLRQDWIMSLPPSYHNRGNLIGLRWNDRLAEWQNGDIDVSFEETQKFYLLSIYSYHENLQILALNWESIYIPNTNGITHNNTINNYKIFACPCYPSKIKWSTAFFQHVVGYVMATLKLYIFLTESSFV